MSVTLTYGSSTVNSITVSVYHTYANGSRAYWDYRQSGSSTWINNGYTLVGRWTNSSYSFSGLNSGTTYEMRVRIIDGSQGSLPELGSATTSGTTTAIPPSNTATVSGTALSKSSIRVAWNTVSNASGYYVDRSTDGISWTHVRTETSTSWTDTGLIEYAMYYYRVRAYNSAGTASGTSSIGTRTLDETNPSVWNVNGEPKSKEIKITWNASDAHSGLSSFRVYRGANFVTKSATDREHTFTNLEENTTYSFYVQAFDVAGNSANSSTIQVTTLDGRPNDWVWSNSKTQGGIFNLTASEWNSFTTRINEFRVYKNLSPISFTQATKGGTFTAAMFNQAKNAIGGMAATGISDRQAEQDILASYFQTLRDRLNSL